MQAELIKGITIRPLRRGETEVVQAVFDRLGPRSRLLRFGGAKTALTAADLELLTRVDGDHHVLVALADNAPIGIARLVRDGADADVAFTVVDEWQHRGVGTILADRLTDEIPTQLVAAGVPQPMVAAFAGGGGGGGALDITGTGDLGARILASLPDAVKPTVEPLIPNIVAGIHEAISIAIASTFWVGIVGAVIAAVFVLFLHEVPMRETFEGGASEPEESAA